MTSLFRISVSLLACPSPLYFKEMASSIVNSNDLSNLSIFELISFICTGAFMESQFDEVARILYSREMEKAKLVAESRYSILEPECTLFPDQCADLEKKTSNCPSNSALRSMTTELQIELQSNLKGEKDRFRLLDQKHRELERFSFGVKEEVDKYKRMFDQHQKYVENVEKDLALMRARDRRGQEVVRQWKCNPLIQRKGTRATESKRSAENARNSKSRSRSFFHENLKLQTNLKKENRMILPFDDRIDQEHKHQIHDLAKLQLIPIKEENNHVAYE